MVKVCGLKVSETSVGAGTVTIVESLIPSAVAMTVVLPNPVPVAKPVSLASLLIVKMLAEEEFHRAEDKI
jgi:hypothetical protein